MTPQASLMVAAPVDRKSVGGLRALLSTMNFAPGRVNAANALVPFEKLENLHFARFLITDDQTLDDVRLYGLPRQEYPLYLTFLCDFDGSPHQSRRTSTPCQIIRHGTPVMISRARLSNDSASATSGERPNSAPSRM